MLIRSVDVTVEQIEGGYKMSVFHSIRSLIQICQTLGLAPFSMNQRTSKWETNSALMALSIIFIAVNGTVILIGIIFNDEFINQKNAMMRILLVTLLLLLSQIQSLCSVFELFLKRNQQISLLNTFEHIDYLFKQNLELCVNYRKLKNACRRIILVWTCEIFAFLFAYLILYTQTKVKYYLNYMIIYFPSYVLCKLSYAYTMILVSLIHANIDVLNEYLKSTTKQNGYYVCETFLRRNDCNRTGLNSCKNEIDPKTLIFLKNIYCKIWEASVSIQNLIYWTFPIGCLNDFYVLVFNSYGLSSSIFSPLLFSNVYFNVLLFTLVTSNLGNMFFIVYNCSKASESVSITSLFFSMHAGKNGVKFC